MAVNQVRQYHGDLQYCTPSISNQNGYVEVNNCSTFSVAFTNARQLADMLQRQDSNNDLWRKILFQVNFKWIRANPKQFRAELERYKEQLENAVIQRIHPDDIRWMKTYVKIMLDILNQEMNAITS